MLKNNIHSFDRIPRSELKEFQGDLKKENGQLLQKLIKTIKKRGFDAPLFLRHDHDNYILDGHQRLKALNQLAQEGYKLPNDKVPVVYIVAETKEEAKEKVLEYNSTYSELNPEAFQIRCMGLDLEGINIPLEFVPEEEREKELKEDEVPALQKTVVVQKGDIFQLGDHLLMCGDATKKEDLQQLLGTDKLDMIRTDPPYNVAYKGNGKNTSRGIKNDNMQDAAFQEFMTEVMQNYKSNLKLGGAAYIFHSASTQDQFMQAIEQSGMEIKTQLIRNKPSVNHVGGDYKQKHEPFFYCCIQGKKPKFFGNIFNASIVDWDKTDEEILSLLHRARQAEKEGKTTIRSMKRHNVQDYVHPTQKPVELAVYAMQNSSKEDDLIGDFFLGSGTALIACEKINRKCRGMELDEEFCQIIIQRYHEYTNGSKTITCLNRHIPLPDLVT